MEQILPEDQIKIYNFCIAMDCGSPTANLSTQNMEYASGSAPSLATYSVQVTIQCLSGYRFSDQSDFKITTCQSNGFWSIISTFCTGIFP